MSFKPASPGTGSDHSVLVPVVMTNSTAYKVGDVYMSYTTGYAVPGAAAGPLLGVCVGFAKANGTPLNPTAYAAGTATGTDVQTVTADSDNQTVAKSVVLLECSVDKRWSAEVSGTINTTATSGVRGVGIDVNSSNTNYGQLLETTATRTAGTCTNFYSHGVDPNDSTRLIVSIRASELHGELS